MVRSNEDAFPPWYSDLLRKLKNKKETSMRPLSNNFIRLAVVYSLIGMGIAIMMVSVDDHSQMPTHAHIMLIGFVTLFLFAVFLSPVARSGNRPATDSSFLADQSQLCRFHDRVLDDL